MQYDTSTISNVFEKLYSGLRRKYDQYAANYQEKQFLLFANVFMLTKSGVPYYTSAQSAFDKNNPAGNLPEALPQQYFQERPLYFFDREQAVNALLANRPIAENPIIILNIPVNCSAQDVYVNYDPKVMRLETHVYDAGVFVAQEKQIVAEQGRLDTAMQSIAELSEKGSNEATRYLNELAANPQYIVTAEKSDGVTQVAAGVSLEWLQKANHDPGSNLTTAQAPVPSKNKFNWWILAAGVALVYVASGNEKRK